MSYNRNAETQRRLKRRYQPRYCNPIYFDEDKGRWMKCEYVGRDCRRMHKRLASKRARKDIEIYQQKGLYRRKNYFWNEMI